MSRSRPSTKWVLERLAESYGAVEFIPRFDALEELICCILSQSTTDVRSFPAFIQLRTHFRDWEHLAIAPKEDIRTWIDSCGLGQQKAGYIQESLIQIKQEFGGYTLESLRTWSLEDANTFLTSLPGVGKKTSAIVLCFSLGLNILPVDTHVLRVSKRLGWVPEKASPDTAHNILNSKLSKNTAYELHIQLIQHGRLTCTAQSPKCSQCALSSRCPSVQLAKTRSTKTRAAKSS